MKHEMGDERGIKRNQGKCKETKPSERREYNGNSKTKLGTSGMKEIIGNEGKETNMSEDTANGHEGK